VPTTRLVDHVHDLDFAALPAEVVAQVKRCLVDLVGAACGGIGTPVSAIVRRHAAENFLASRHGARMLLDGRRVSMPGAAMAGGFTIDAFDAHDGHALTKGHAGVAVLPGLLAVIDARGIELDGRSFIAAVALGYEIAIRAGIAMHRTARDYHTSGSWNALAVAALVARLMRLSHEQTRHALGIAEYHGPRSPMMRCIDFPSMVKDGSGWGAMAGMSAALLAADGFTGAPAEITERPDTADLWSDLGERWRILELYFKPWPVCRWAQPALQATIGLVREHGVMPDAIAEIEVATFHEATRLAMRAPTEPDAAQYSLPFPVAAALVRGRLGAEELIGAALTDRAILAMSQRIKLIDDPEFSRVFPARRFARVTLQLKDGRRFASPATEALGDPDRPMSDAQIAEKYRGFATPVLGRERSEAIAAAVAAMSTNSASIAAFVDGVLESPSSSSAAVAAQ
jgi:2-methylcitrate dehydratase PrpD